MRPMDWSRPDFGDLQAALIGVPMDLGISNRSGCRFGPRALRSIERVGPYNHVLRSAPTRELRVADIGDVPLSSRYSLEQSHRDIESIFAKIHAAGVIPLSAGGDHSITDRKSTRLNSSHLVISYAVFCLKKKKTDIIISSHTMLTRPACQHSCKYVT